MTRTTFLGLVFTAASALTTGIASAGELVSIVFEDSSIMFGGEKVECDCYYILLGDNGGLDSGQVLQIAQMSNDREHCSIGKGRFTWSADDRITVYWDATEGKKYGSTEKARMENFDKATMRFQYRIYQHDDQSQVGETQACRAVQFSSLPNYVQNAVQPYRRARMSPQERMLYNKMLAAQIEASEQFIADLLK